MRIAITAMLNSFYEWEPTADDETRAVELFETPLSDITELSLSDLCRLVEPSAPAGMSDAQHLLLLNPGAFKGRNVIGAEQRIQSRRMISGRVVYGGE